MKSVAGGVPWCTRRSWELLPPSLAELGQPSPGGSIPLTGPWRLKTVLHQPAHLRRAVLLWSVLGWQWEDGNGIYWVFCTWLVGLDWVKKICRNQGWHCRRDVLSVACAIWAAGTTNCEVKPGKRQQQARQNVFSFSLKSQILTRRRYFHSLCLNIHERIYNKYVSLHTHIPI